MDRPSVGHLSHLQSILPPPGATSTDDFLTLVRPWDTKHKNFHFWTKIGHKDNV